MGGPLLSATGAEPPERTPEQTSRTTVRMRNLPDTVLRDDIAALLDSHGFKSKYNLVYVPTDLNSGLSFGHAFVNLGEASIAQECISSLDGLAPWPGKGGSRCEVAWSDAHQGLEAHIERYRNSPFMHPDMPDALKPALFDTG